MDPRPVLVRVRGRARRASRSSSRACKRSSSPSSPARTSVARWRRSTEKGGIDVPSHRTGRGYHAGPEDDRQGPRESASPPIGPGIGLGVLIGKSVEAMARVNRSTRTRSAPRMFIGIGSDRGAGAVRHRVLVHHLREADRARESSSVLAQESVSDKRDLYPDRRASSIVGALAFAILFYFMWKWVILGSTRLPRGAARTDPGPARERRADAAAGGTRAGLSTRRSSRARARTPTGSSRRRARPPKQFRRDIQAKAEEESRNIVARGPGRDPRRARPCVQRAACPGGGHRRDPRRARGGRRARHEVPSAPDRRVHRAGRLGRERAGRLSGTMAEFLDRLFGKDQRIRGYAIGARRHRGRPRASSTPSGTSSSPSRSAVEQNSQAPGGASRTGRSRWRTVVRSSTTSWATGPTRRRSRRSRC